MYIRNNSFRGDRSPALSERPSDRLLFLFLLKKEDNEKYYAEDKLPENMS